MRVSFACILTVLSLAACAPGNPHRQAGDPPDLERQCKTLGALAAVVIAARQTGRRRDEVLRSLTKKGAGLNNTLIRTIVDVAYKTHLEPTAARKRAVVKSFAGYAVKTCYQAYRNSRIRSAQSETAPAGQAPVQRTPVRNKPRRK